VAIGLATAALPPAVAWNVNRARVTRAAAEVSALAARLRMQEGKLRRLGGDADVLVGPGRMPVAEAADAQPWTSGRRASLSLTVDDAPWSADPWGNSYLVNVAILSSARPRALWILSAGPNGIVETPFSADESSAPVGDDVAVRVRLIAP
jgi:hypothetical protein